MASNAEMELALQILVARLPEPQREYVFAKPRRWRFDFCWPKQKLAAEIEGGTWTAGRHSRGDGFSKDCEKYNQATLQGWKVLRFTTGMVTDGTALTTIGQALGMEL